VKANKSWSSGGWGGWHTSTEIPGDCPQDHERHTVEAAVALNEKAREYRRAVMWARHKQWIGAGRKPPGSTPESVEVGEG
jgi:hypothetical protein